MGLNRGFPLQYQFNFNVFSVFYQNFLSQEINVGKMNISIFSTTVQLLNVTGWIKWLGKFAFWVIFSKIFKHHVQGICGQVHWLKKPMFAYVKICLEIINFLFFAQNK